MSVLPTSQTKGLDVALVASYDPNSAVPVTGHALPVPAPGQGFQSRDHVYAPKTADAQRLARLRALQTRIDARAHETQEVAPGDGPRCSPLLALPAGPLVAAMEYCNAPEWAALARSSRRFRALVAHNAAYLRDLKRARAAAPPPAPRPVTLPLMRDRRAGPPSLPDAVQSGDCDAVAQALDRGESLTARDVLGMCPLHMAAMDGRRDVVALLLDRGGDVDALTDDGRTALHIACQEAMGDVVGLLLQRGARLGLQDGTGTYPIHCACRTDRPDVVQALLARDKGQLALKDRFALTPLHVAASSGCRAVVQQLLTAKADAGAKTSVGQTPLALAKQTKQSAVVKLLDKGGGKGAGKGKKKR